MKNCWFIISLFINLLALPIMFITESCKNELDSKTFERNVSEYSVVIIFGSATQLILFLIILQTFII